MIASWQRVGLLGLCEGWTSDTTVMDCVFNTTPSLPHFVLPHSLIHSLPTPLLTHITRVAVAYGTVNTRWIVLINAHPQVKEDFVHGSLHPPVSINNAIWMVATDMAKEAVERDKTFNSFT